MKEKKFITIINKDIYKYRLEMDDIKGIIRLTKNDTSKPNTKITNRNIPITDSIKWQFHKQRTGYSEVKSNEYNFVGSYIDRNAEYDNYNKWKEYILNTYKELKESAIDN